MKLLSIDYGNKRIGLAVGETEDKTVVPFGMVENKGMDYVLQELKKVLSEENIERVVIGIPVHRQMESMQEKSTKEFIEFLKSHLGIEIDTVDETFSSRIAEKNELYHDLYKDRSAGWVDSVAAAEILRTYILLNFK